MHAESNQHHRRRVPTAFAPWPRCSSLPRTPRGSSSGRATLPGSTAARPSEHPARQGAADNSICPSDSFVHRGGRAGRHPDDFSVVAQLVADEDEHSVECLLSAGRKSSGRFGVSNRVHRARHHHQQVLAHALVVLYRGNCVCGVASTWYWRRLHRNASSAEDEGISDPVRPSFVSASTRETASICCEENGSMTLNLGPPSPRSSCCRWCARYRRCSAEIAYCPIGPTLNRAAASRCSPSISEPCLRPKRISNPPSNKASTWGQQQPVEHVQPLVCRSCRPPRLDVRGPQQLWQGEPGHAASALPVIQQSRPEQVFSWPRRWTTNALSLGDWGMPAVSRPEGIGHPVRQRPGMRGGRTQDVIQHAKAVYLHDVGAVDRIEQARAGCTDRQGRRPGRCTSSVSGNRAERSSRPPSRLERRHHLEPAVSGSLLNSQAVRAASCGRSKQLRRRSLGPSLVTRRWGPLHPSKP